MKKIIYSAYIFSSIYFISCGNKNELKNEPVTETENKADSSFVIINQKIRSDINNPELYIERAKLYAGKQDIPSALADIDRAIKLDSLKPEYYILKADYLLFQKKIAEVKEVLNTSLRLNPNNTETNLKLAELALFLRDNKQALEYINHVLKTDIYNSQAYYMKGIIFMENGDTIKAISSLQTAVEQNPDYYDAYIQLGVLFSIKKNPLAKQYYLNALKLKPNSIEALYNLGMYCQENNLLNEAIEYYNQILTIDRHNALANFNLGYLHLVHLHILPEAVKYFSKAIEARNNYYEAYYNRGYAYELMKDWLNAETNYRQALSIQPDYTLAAEGLSRVLEKK